MLAIFQTISESCSRRMWSLRDGETARVGRTEWAEWAVPGDLTMRDIHFSVVCSKGSCLIDDLTDGRTMVNGEQVKHVRLSNGDQIQAGNTLIRVTIEGETFDVRGPSAEEERKAVVEQITNDDSVFVSTIAQIAEAAELEPNHRQVVVGYEDYRSATAALIARADETNLSARDRLRWLFAALRFLSFALPVQEGVRWAYQGHIELLGDDISKESQTARDSAFRWLDDPSAENCKQADAAAQATGLRSSAGWLAMAAAWSHGIHTEDGDGEQRSPSEINEDHGWLSSRAVAGAVTMAVIESATDMATLCRKLVALGLKANTRFE